MTEEPKTLEIDDLKFDFSITRANVTTGVTDWSVLGDLEIQSKPEDLDKFQIEVEKFIVKELNRYGIMHNSLYEYLETPDPFVGVLHEILGLRKILVLFIRARENNDADGTAINMRKIYEWFYEKAKPKHKAKVHADRASNEIKKVREVVLENITKFACPMIERGMSTNSIAIQLEKKGIVGVRGSNLKRSQLRKLIKEIKDSNSCH